MLHTRWCVNYLSEPPDDGTHREWGSVSADQCIISLWIGPQMTAEMVLHTLLHEIIHALEDMLHLTVEDRVVDLVALGMTSWLVGNHILTVTLEDSDGGPTDQV